MKCHECNSSKIMLDDRPQLIDGSLVFNYICSNCLHSGEHQKQVSKIKITYENKRSKKK
jgi:hypothetical protein